MVYLDALQTRIGGRKLEKVRIVAPSLVRTAIPPIQQAEGKQVLGPRRMGKRICIGLEHDLWLVLHLMIAGRLHWPPSAQSSSVHVALRLLTFPTEPSSGPKRVRRSARHCISSPEKTLFRRSIRKVSKFSTPS